MAWKRVKHWMKAFVRFRPPLINACVHSQSFIAEYPCVLITWNVVGASKVIPKPLRKSYAMQNGSVMLAIPNSVTEITLVAKNIWGSDRRRLILKTLHVDASISSALSSQASLIQSKSTTVNPNRICLKTAFKTKTSRLRLFTPAISINPNSIKYPYNYGPQN
jgi:hypothetical protein